MALKTKIRIKDDILANWKHRTLLTKFYETIILWGGRGSAKTLDLVRVLVVECLREDYFNLVVVFPNENKMRQGVFADFTNFIYEHNLQSYFQITKSPMEINCVNGNQIIFRGGQEKENAKGLSEPNRMWFEEANLIPEESHDTFLTSMRSQKGDMKTYYSFNPEARKIKYEDHWIYKRFFAKLVEQGKNIYDTIIHKDTNTIMIHSTLDDNPLCPAGTISRIESFKDINPVRHKIWRFGRWSAKDNDMMFAHKFDMDKHVKKVAYIPDLPIHLSFDQNYKPYSTCTLYQTYKEGDTVYINLFDEICLTPPNNSTEAICDEFKRRYDPKTIFIYGDHSGNAKTQKIERTLYKNHYDLIVEHLAKYINSRSKKVYPNPPRDVRHNIINRILSEEWNYVLQIDPRCKNSINDFLQLEIDENNCYKKAKQDGVELVGHTMDTFVYFLHGCFFSLFKR